jgi:hypothetical protein
MNITITNPHEIEETLAHSAELAVIEAQSIIITDNDQYGLASQLLVEHKKRIKAVKDYWDKPKSMAKQAHQEICDKEKAMLAPFTQAETIIKAAMVTYQRKVEEERRAAEAEARKRQQEEAERLLAEAIKAEDSGNTTRANAVMAMAQTIDEMPVVSEVEAPKASGISTRKTWKARVIDEKLVPAYANGPGLFLVEIRTINQSTLNNIARTSNGTARIPGVEFYEDVTISARA